MLGLVIFIILCAISGLHMLWGAGVYWPFKSSSSLAAGAVGAANLTKAPPPIASFAVAIALGVSAIWVLALSDWIPVRFVPEWGVAVGGMMIATVFLARGIFGLTPMFARLTPVEPFRTLDRRFYTPLCIALGAGIFILAIG